jgi:hypothetical protein
MFEIVDRCIKRINIIQRRTARLPNMYGHAEYQCGSGKLLESRSSEEFQLPIDSALLITAINTNINATPKLKLIYSPAQNETNV